ncbi:hypothetical protein D0962_21260 [Leptolyngbyaceae cyanobacterium CCMR0082]|uniref:Uncharacterized protein n=1 Tax=Adonisia turfae CCMR0082 TaxID=2304604 RepID=A0A6M0SA18_9CYAN|nr:hypothetical protein [Adonisia turfae]NEZ65270.1 hypothetical protein [Adonisia turfae CCMR0082]
MRAHKNYLLKLDKDPSIRPQEGSQSTIYDWSGGESFQVINVATTKTKEVKTVHVLAIFNNSYGASNLQGSRLRYRNADNKFESRAIIGITALDE